MLSIRQTGIHQKNRYLQLITVQQKGIPMFKQWITGLMGLLCGMMLIYGFASPTQAQSVTCNLINYQDAMIVFFAPVHAHAQIKETLGKNEPYVMVGASGGFFEIEYDGGEHGWIDYHTRIMNGGCTPYIDNPSPALPLSDFPTVCTYTITETLTGYSDRELTQVHGGFGSYPAGTYAVVVLHENAIELEGSGDMSGGYVEANRGTLNGHCDGTLQLATVLDNARLWTEPDVITGEIISTLNIGTEVGIISEPVRGRLQYASDLMGDWVEVRTGSTVTGWIWIERLELGKPFTAPSLLPKNQATVTENTRIWSEPNAKIGEILTTLPTGAKIKITGGAQIGFIQLESDLQGAWYPVTYGETTGWVYEGRINFNP